MQAKWTIAPWMRRRMARYLARGTSERVIACVMAPASSPGDTPDPGAAAWQEARVDRSNVILFRALGGAGMRPPARFH